MVAQKILACLLLISLEVRAQKNDIEVACVPHSVTVYNSSAEIHYTQKVNVPAGKSTIIFTDLTPFIVENTVNITATIGELDIVTVTERINFTKVKQENGRKISSLQDSVYKTDRELGLLRCKKDALTHERDLLFKNESIGGLAKGVSVEQIEAAADFYNKRYYNLSVQIYDLDIKENRLKSQLQTYQRQISEFSVNVTKTCSEIEVVVNATSGGNVTFDFKFLTDKAGWAPSYDCKFQGVGEPIKFNFKANVFNATGNHWENINIKLSTASPTEGFDAPSLNEEKNNPNVTSANENVKFIEIQVANSIAEYDIKHKYSIPSDSKPYLVEVSSMDLKADFYYLLIPKMDPFGFLMTKIPDWNKYNLIPGVTNVYNKGSYMGKTFLNTYAENDTLNIYLGKDNSIQSTRKEKNVNHENNLIGNYYVDKSAISISIRNSGNSNVPVMLLDQVPVFDDSDDEKFSIQGIQEAVYDKNEGLLTWNFTLAGGETKEIDFKYEVKIPKNNIGNYKPAMKKFRTISCPSF